jgi:K+-sensing histidine kinase KdpD
MRQKRLANTIIGFFLCTLLAGLGVWLFADTPYRPDVPLAFILVDASAAILWGCSGAIAGLLAAAALFAFFLFEPLGSWSVASQEARTNLSWMLLLGLVSAFLLARSPASGQQNEHSVGPDGEDDNAQGHEPRGGPD